MWEYFRMTKVDGDIHTVKDGEHSLANYLHSFDRVQWRIQDFPLGERQPPMRTLFGNNVRKQKNWVLLGGHLPAAPPGSATGVYGLF